MLLVTTWTCKIWIYHITKNNFYCSIIKIINGEGNHNQSRYYGQSCTFMQKIILHEKSFFSRYKTTQHCEAVNAFLNRFLDRQTRLYELFQQVNRALTCILHNEVGVDFTSKYITSIMITRLVKIEKYITNILTREIFHMYIPQFVY